MKLVTATAVIKKGLFLTAAIVIAAIVLGVLFNLVSWLVLGAMAD